MLFPSRALRAALALGLALTALSARAADPWPTRPIKIVVPFAPGGPSDSAGRILGEGLQRELGQSIVIENRGGAGASIGAAAVARAAPDGYTFLLGHAASVSFTPQIRKVDYDPQRDFVPVAAYASNYTLLVTRKDFGPRNMTELKQLMLAKPAGVSCGTAGAGSGSHIACERMADLMGAKLLVVHYKGSAEAVTDILAGRVDLMFDPSSLQHVKAGALKILGTRGKDNSRFAAELPDVPSFAEQGFPEITDEIWIGLLAPTGTDPRIVARMAEAMRKVSEDPAVAAKLLKVSQYPAFVGSTELKQKVAGDVVFYKALAKKLNLSAD